MPSGAIRLSAPTLSHDDGATTASCIVSLPGKAPQELWIRSTCHGGLNSADSFAALALLPAMKLRVPVISDGAISRTLLDDGFPRIQRIFEIWREDPWNPEFPRFHQTDILAEGQEDGPEGEGVATFFSGGVDSSFSLLEAIDEITHLIFIEHFEEEFPPEEAQKAVAGVINVAHELAKEIVIVQTNAKIVFSDYVSWHFFHGALLAAVAHQLQGQVSKVHIPSSDDVRHLDPWGSHPCLDPLWSTSATALVHDRNDVTRLQKTARIADNPLLLKNLRVCWRPYQNCGRCSKCIRTKFALKALDRLTVGFPFDTDQLTAQELKLLQIRDDAPFFQEVVDYLEDEGRHPELVAAVRQALSGWYQTPLGSLFRGDLTSRSKRWAKRQAFKAFSATGTVEPMRRARTHLKKRLTRGQS